MQRRIDLVAAYVFILTLGFLLFDAATGSRSLALVLTLALGFMVRICYRAWRSRFGSAREGKRTRMRAASALVTAWAIKPDAAMAEACVRQRYPKDEPFDFMLVSHHHSCAFGADELINAWREHIGQARLVIAVTAPVEAAAQAQALRLKEPQIRLLDAKMLEDALVRGDAELPEAGKARRAPRLHHLAPNRKKAPLCLMYALFMLGAFWALGSPVYLVAALLLLMLAALGFHRPKPPEQLF